MKKEREMLDAARHVAERNERRALRRMREAEAKAKDAVEAIVDLSGCVCCGALFADKAAAGCGQCKKARKIVQEAQP